MTDLLLVGTGGFAGSAARYALSFIIRVSELEKLNADIQDLEATSHLP